MTGRMMLTLSKSSFTFLEMRQKASLTPSHVLALTSMNNILQFSVEQSSAIFCPSAADTTLSSSGRSLLLARMILGTPGGVFSLIWTIHLFKLSKEERSLTAQARMMAEAPLQQVSVMVRYLSWPAVSQICSLTLLSSTLMDLALKSTPMVATQLSLKGSLMKLRIRLVLPTPLSPIMIILARTSQESLARIQQTLETVYFSLNKEASNMTQQENGLRMW